MASARLISLAAGFAAVVSGVAVAQPAPGHSQHHQPGMTPASRHVGMQAGSSIPTLPGQAAFGAIQEIVAILDSDPKTDWSKVDL